MHPSNAKALMGTAIDLGGNRRIMHRDHIYVLSGPRPIVCACKVYVYSFVCAYLCMLMIFLCRQSICLILLSKVH